MIVPNIDWRANGTVSNRHDNRKAQTARVIDSFGHIKKPLACSRRIGSPASNGSSNCHGHCGKLTFDIDVLAILQNTLSTKQS